MISITGQSSASYEYDDSTERIKKVSSGSTTYYVGELYEEKGNDDISYIYMGTQRVASVINGTVMFYLADHLGGSNILSDMDGTELESSEYLPYGEFWEHTQSGPANQKSRYYFTDQYLDDESGLYYYNARYYNPALGRFIQADTIIPDATNPQSFNRYSYVNNNPINYTDPSGHSSAVLLSDAALDDYYVQGFSGGSYYHTESSHTIQFYNDNNEPTSSITHSNSFTASSVQFGGGPDLQSQFASGAYNSFAGGLNYITDPGRITGALDAMEQASYSLMVSNADGPYPAAEMVGASGIALSKIGKFAVLGLAKFGNNKWANKQVAAVAQRLKMSPAQRDAFGKFIEGSKKEVGKGGADNFSFQDLLKEGEQFLELWGK